MKKGWNRWSTQKTKGMWALLERWNRLAWVCTPLAMEKGEWTCWGLYGMAMERSCSLWRRREFWDHSVPPNTTRSTRLSLCGCDLTTSISSTGMQGQANEKSARAHKQTTCPGNHPRSTPQKPMFRTTFVTCSRTHQGMDTDGLEQVLSPKKSHQRSQSTGCVLVRKAPTTLTQSGNSTVDFTQSGNSTTGQRQRGLPRDDRDGVAGNSLRQSVHTPFTWPGCEVELGTCHCLSYYVHLVHTRIPFFHTRVPMEGHRRRQRIYPLWW